jgi:hypothetical protein
MGRTAHRIASARLENPLASIRIYRKDGRPTPFFWREKDGKDRTRKLVFRRREGRTTRMKGVHFNVQTNEFVKEKTA